SNRPHAKLHDLIYENAQLRARGFENTSESVKNTSGTSVTPRIDKPKLSTVTPHSKKLHASTQSHSVPQPREFNVVKHRNVIAFGMFKINPSQTPKENVSSNTVTASSTRLVHTARTRRPQPKGNTRNARVPSTSKSSDVEKIVTVEDHRRTLLLSKNQKTMSSKCIPTGSDEFPLPEQLPTAYEDKFPLLIQSDATAILFKKQQVVSEREMEHSNNTLAKIPILDTGKFEQWKFRIQQYLQHEHYALWEVIEFGDSYIVPTNDTATVLASEGTATKKGMTVALTTEDMQKRRNDVKARTTLLLALPDEHQLRFSKYKTTQELWAAILKTFGANEATKKTKKNLLKHQYGNFKAKGKETLEQTFNILQAIVSQLEFMDMEFEQDDLNQKLLTSLSPEWLMHTIVWRNRSDLDTMSLDDLYNHLKVYEPEVQKKSDYQNMAFISSSKNSSGNEEDNTAGVPTASTQVSTAGATVAPASISLDTACAFIVSQSNGSQLKYEVINQINKDDIEEMDIKWNMALLSMMVDRYWKKTGKKISIQGTDVAGFDKSNV
nr:hypothetical protein [Tanacetum cinerariifolium]